MATALLSYFSPDQTSKDFKRFHIQYQGFVKKHKKQRETFKLCYPKKILPIRILKYIAKK